MGRPASSPGVHLRSVRVRRPPAAPAGRFPFDIPAVRELGTLAFDGPVTFLVGENGSGKSTVLEAVAAATGLPAVGSTATDRDDTLGPQRALGRALALTWNRRVRRGFFLRAEDFFGFAKRIAQLEVELAAELGSIEVAYRDASPYTRGLAAGPAAASLAELKRLYGEDGLDARSHGESFLRLFQERLVPDALYLLDEPEAALSPQSQLGLIAMIRASVLDGCQFIIATHSPMLLAYPNARIYSFDRAPVAAVAFEELEHVTLMRAFLNEPERFLRHLIPEG
jgi:predicted ATPase